MKNFAFLNFHSVAGGGGGGGGVRSPVFGHPLAQFLSSFFLIKKKN